MGKKSCRNAKCFTKHTEYDTILTSSDRFQMFAGVTCFPFMGARQRTEVIIGDTYRLEEGGVPSSDPAALLLKIASVATLQQKTLNDAISNLKRKWYERT